MSSIIGIFKNGLNFIMKNGIQSTIEINTYVIPAGSYDDEGVVTLVGSTVTSGLLYPVRARDGSEEALLMEQGKLLQQDKTLYLPGSPSINFSGTLLFNVGGSMFTMVPNGLQTWQLTGTDIYHKLYLRHTITGSLF